MNDKESFAFFAEGLLPLGINLAVIEYTLAPMARLERIVAEVRRSVRWLAEHLADMAPIRGIYDLEPIRLSYLNEKLGLDTAEAERNSPVRHLPATRPEIWWWLTAAGNCPNCAASRSSMPGRGPNGVFWDACCRWTA